MPAKKADSGYAALRGHIPKDLYKRFRIHCLERDVDNSQGLEDLLREYFELKENKADNTETVPTPTRTSTKTDRPTETQPAEPTATKPAAAKAKRGKVSKEAS